MVARTIRVVALGILLSVAVAGVVEAKFGCRYLVVYLNESKTPMRVDKRPECKHGYLKGGGGNRIMLEQSLTNGPDCEISVYEIDGRRRATFRVQQDFCFLESGDVSVHMIHGGVQFTKKEGSYTHGNAGEIRIIDFEKIKPKKR